MSDDQVAHLLLSADPCSCLLPSFAQMCEATYLGIFTFEMTVKIFSYGFVLHEHSYLRDSWCQLDFAVVTLAWMPIIFPGFGNFSGARTDAASARREPRTRPDRTLRPGLAPLSHRLRHPREAGGLSPTAARAPSLRAPNLILSTSPHAASSLTRPCHHHRPCLRLPCVPGLPPQSSAPSGRCARCAL